MFSVRRATPDLDGVFIVGDLYEATITELDFLFKGRDSMTVHLRSDEVDLEGLWATEDFSRDFKINHKGSYLC